MKTSATIMLLGAVALLFLGFNNCAKSHLDGQGYLNEASGPGSPEPDSQCKAQLLQSASSAPEKVAADLATGPISSGTRLLVLLDNDCYRAQAGSSWLTSELRARGFRAHEGSSTAASLALEREIQGEDLAREAQADRCVLNVDRDVALSLTALPNDPYYSTNQRYLPAIKHDLVVDQLYNAANGINRTVKIAVLDSGVDVNHPDLQGLFLRDSQGQLIALNGIDNSRDVADTGFHGTHVTGLIAAAANNSIGISGVMGQNAKILPVKVSSDGTSVNLSAVVNGIRWAADSGAEVINMSLGGPEERPSMKEALAYAIKKGAFIVVAAGNDGKTLGTEGAKFYPALFSKDLEGMITVGSFDAGSRQLSSFSNRSPIYVDLLAPGSDGSFGIVSTVPANLSPSNYARTFTLNGVARPIQGTSMAAPLASGAAALAVALARSRGYDALPSQIEELLAAGSAKDTGLALFANSGRLLDLNALTAWIDQDTGLSLSSTTDRNQAQGRVGISAQPSGVDTSAGNPFELRVTKSPDSSVLVNYQWYKNGIKINGANRPTLSIERATAASIGSYRVELKAGAAAIASREAFVKVSGSSCP